MRGSIRMNTGFAIACSVLIFLSGGIAGAMIAGHFQKKTYERTIDQARKGQKEAEENLTSVLEYRRKVLEKQEQGLDESLKTVGQRPKTEYSKIRPLRKNPDLMAMAAKYADPSGDEDEFMPVPSIESHLAERDGPRDDIPIREPFEISAEDFEMEMASTNTSILYYYKEDRALVDERDVIILNPIEVVGEAGMEALDGTKEDVLYFRNDTYELNYEVDVRHGMNYRRDILGAIDEPMADDEEEEEDEVGDGVGEFDDFNPRHPG